MDYLEDMESTEETKNRIMMAAMGRILQYGFNKTTMAEIAKDCNMSSANIYRFFESKGSIVAEMAKGCFRDKEDALREVTRRPGMSAAERLEELVLQTLRSGHAMICERPKANEVIEYISVERHDILAQHKEVKQSLVAEILAEGKKSGEFDLQDIDTTAEAFLTATVFFACPTNLERPLEELEQEAKAVIDLLVRGLKK